VGVTQTIPKLQLKLVTS